jgi:acetyl-CoA synthetase
LRLVEEQRFYPTQGYTDYRNKALQDIEEFWAKEAEDIPWFKHWEKTLVWDEPFAQWFKGGMTNASYACLDAHLATDRKNKVAYYWEDEFGNTRTYSYLQLYAEVNKFASALKKIGVKKGDIVMMYLPMIPELPIAMLAATRLGAAHSIVFSGFSSQALADRIIDTEAKVVITADSGLRRGKYIPLKGIVDQACNLCPTVKHVIVVKRGPADQQVEMTAGRDVFYHDVMKTPTWRPSRSRHPNPCSPCILPAPPGSQRASSTRRAASLFIASRPSSGSSTRSPTPYTGAQPTSAGSPATPISSTPRSFPA